jgi:hypothetical protein
MRVVSENIVEKIKTYFMIYDILNESLYEIL